MPNICVFDIETIPDIEGFKKLNRISHKEDNFSNIDYFDFIKQTRRAEVGNEFVRHHLQKIVAISVVMVVDDKIKCASLSDINSNEAEIISSFFSLIENYKPTLVSWNGNGFDLPVINYRSLINSIKSPHYWDVGHFDNQMKWSNYQSRFHYKHIDLMDVISSFQGRATASLNDICILCDFPGKLDTDGSDVLNLFLENNVEDIRNYCETDVLNTYLVYLRFQLIRGFFDEEEYLKKTSQLKRFLEKQEKNHFTEFLNKWNSLS